MARNNVKTIQEMLMREMQRLDNDDIMGDENRANAEVRRSNSLSNTAQSFIKATNLNIKVLELREKHGDSVIEEVGINE